MRLLINTSVLRFGGAVQVALSFIGECRAYFQHDYHVVLGPGVGAVLKPSSFPPNFHFHQKDFGLMGLRAARRVHQEMSTIEEQVRPDCVVTTSGPAYWRSRAPHLMGFNLPLYIYPESPYLQSLPHGRKLRLAARRWLHCRYFRRDAEAFIVQTDDVNQRVRRLFNTDRVHTVTNNCNGWYSEPPSPFPQVPPKKEGTFRFLTLSAYYAHKNLELIPKVIDALPERLRSRVEFVLTLSEDEYREKIGTAVPAQVRLVGDVSPPDCPALYARCDAMFLPTLAECFSASYPEAMKMGTPIVTTDLGFARSICEDAALYFTACDAQSAAAQIVRLVEDRALQGRLRELGAKRLAAFDTPEQRADKILTLCEQLASGQATGSPGRVVHR